MFHILSLCLLLSEETKKLACASLIFLLSASCQSCPDLGGAVLDDENQDDQSEQEGADHAPSAPGDSDDKGGTDTAGTDQAEGCGILEVDIETVDDRGDKGCGQLRQNAAADLLEGCAACRVQ